MLKARAQLALAALLGWMLAPATPARAAILWSDLGETLAHETGPGSDILGGAVKQDDSSTNTLYFKFHVEPFSDARTEPYFAAFQLYQADNERLAVGNSQGAWAYSAFNTAETGNERNVPGDFDLRSSRPERRSEQVFTTFEFPVRGIERTIVFKVEYIAGETDRVTVWLNPDLAPGATEDSQPESLTTRFTADASFDQIRLRHGGGGGGWSFSDMAIATSFNDFIAPGNAEPGPLAPGARRGASAFSFRAWQREQGLPRNSVRALAQTRDGYLWMGTDDGLTRFDGARFVSFGWREGLRSGPVRRLLEDSRGALWSGGADGGLTRWQDGRFTTFTRREGLPSDSITALAEDNAGGLWAGTDAGLAVWQDGRWAPPSAGAEFNGKTITTLFEDRKGTLWVGVRGAGIFRLSEGRFVPFTDPSVEGLLQDPHCLLVDQGGRIWIGAGDDFVLCREGGQWRRYRIPRHLARPYISSLAEAPDGSVWAGSVSEGLFQFKSGNPVAINASSGLVDNSVESLLVDREGNLLAGTGAGLNQLRPKNVSVLGPAEGLGYGAVTALAEIAPGLIWAGKPNDGLHRWDGRIFSRLAPAALSRNEPQINCLLMTRDGSCWAGCGQGLLRFKQPEAAAETVEPVALPGLNVISLFEDGDGTLWAGTQQGQLWQSRDGNCRPETNFWQPHPLTALMRDREGSMWVGTEGGGLHRFGGSQRAHYGKGNGLLSDSIRTLFLDEQGVLWIGTGGGGLARWQGGRITSFTTREGLPDDTISQILADNAGRLWLGNNRGIACVSRRELDEVSERKSAVYPKVYGRAEGMVSEECAGAGYPAGLKTKSGLLWFSSSKGIVVVDPRPRPAALPAPSVVVEEVLIDGEAAGPVTLNASETPAQGGQADPATAVGQIRIGPGTHRVELLYSGISFRAPERVRFRYRLEPLEPDWVEAGTRRTAFYNYIPPGNYHFRVIACNGEGVWNDTGATLALTVLPHFWQTWWFLGSAAFGLLGSVGGTVRLVEKRKLNRRLRHIEQERALERERARIARDLHDDLGSSLTRISLLSTLARADRDNPAQVDAHAEKISESAAQTVRALEEIVWAVRPGSDSLQSLVEYTAHFANELFEGATTRCRLDLPHDLPAQPLPPEMRHNLFLIVKEALTNALKHAQAREVRVQAKVFDGCLGIVVQDDGRGFEPAAALPEEGKRNGLTNMRRRAEAVGATLSVQSAREKGTEVRLTVKLCPSK